MIASYSYLFDYGDGEATAIPVPSQAAYFRLHEVALSCIEAFAGDTTTGSLIIGVSGDTDAYLTTGEITLADTDGLTIPLSAYAGGCENVVAIPNDVTQLEVAAVAGTGGTPAGQAITTIVIEWLKRPSDAVVGLRD